MAKVVGAMEQQRKRTMTSIATRGKLLVAIPVAFQVMVLIALAAVITWHNRTVASQASEERVISATYRLLSLLVDAETGMRGYLLTQDRVFTEPYDRAVLKVPAEMADLERLAPGERVASIRRSAERVLAYHRNSLVQARTGRLAEALEDVRKRTGKTLMDECRKDVDAFVAHYRERAAAQQRATEQTTATVVRAMAGGFAINLLVAFGISIYFTRSIARRIEVIQENVDRYAQGLPLRAAQAGDDEIARLDAGFHQMAEAVTAGRKQLERANGELEAFSYSVSHDLRAPVRALNGYAKILEEDYAGALDAEGNRFLGVIRGEAERLGTLIDDLLSFSRLGKSPLRAAKVDMNELVSDVARELVPEGAALEVATLPPALGDRSMLRHVLVNLLSNAVKFSAPARAVEIEIFAFAGQREHTYSVRDHGVGYDPRYQAKLFGVFQRLHSESEFEGTGVGLAIVKRVVERHGGRVSSEAAPGAGATFTFTLPAAEVQENE